MNYSAEVILLVMVKYGLLIVDMINLFLSSDTPWNNDNAQIRGRVVINPIARLADALRKKKLPVIYVNHGLRRVADGYDDGMVFERLEHIGKTRGYPKLPLTRETKDMFLSGTKWTQTIDELQPHVSDYIVLKNRNSGFYGGDLETLLTQLKVDTLIITGVSTNLCIRATCFDAFQKGWKTIIPRECVESYSDRAQEQGLEDLAFTTSYVISVEETLTLVQNSN